MTPPGRAPLTLFTTLARNLPMATAVHGLGAYQLSRALSLTLRDREIVIDRTCVHCGCEYEWGVHVEHFGERAGLTAEQNRSLLTGTSTDPCWTSGRDRTLIDFVDSLCRTHDIDDELWARAAAVFDEPQLLDIMTLCGWYHAVCFTARAARLRPEPGAARFADFADSPDSATDGSR
jgi:alkylhydroperoxidase family enzyme